MTTITKIGVIGAGQMGAGIAQVFAQAGYETLMCDANQQALTRGVQGIQTQLKKLVEKEKISQAVADSTIKKITPVQSLSELKGCHLVVEAIIEQFEAKAALLAELDGLLTPEAIIASNTSSISITRLAATTKRAQKVMGVHFMNPVPVMKLVELIRGLQTSDETFAAIQALMQKIEKTTVLAPDGAGFIVNRILVPMVNEAIYLLQEGATATDIDTAMKLGTNQPMGPLELADFVGLDTLLFILQVLHRDLGEDKYRPCPLLVRYVEAGWYGRKTKKGFYSY